MKKPTKRKIPHQYVVNGDSYNLCECNECMEAGLYNQAGDTTNEHKVNDYLTEKYRHF